MAKSLKLYTRKDVQQSIELLDTIESRLCAASSSNSLDSWYPTRMLALFNKKCELRQKFAFALKWGIQLVWED